MGIFKWIVATLFGVAAWHVARWSVSISQDTWPQIGALALFWVLVIAYSVVDNLRD